MVLVEMSFCGAGGLEELVSELAAAVEGVLQRHAAQWNGQYPITLRESLRMGLQQQIVGGHACHCQSGGDQDPATYRVWIALPDGGLRAWTQTLQDRVLDGCGLHRGGTPQLARSVQSALVAVLGPCLQKVEASSLLPGLAPINA